MADNKLNKLDRVVLNGTWYEVKDIRGVSRLQLVFEARQGESVIRFRGLIDGTNANLDLFKEKYMGVETTFNDFEYVENEYTNKYGTFTYKSIIADQLRKMGFEIKTHEEDVRTKLA